MAKRHVALISTVMLAWACLDSDQRSNSVWSGSIDTLASGAIIVSNPPNGLWSPTDSWSLSESLRIGETDGSGPAVFGRIMAVAVDENGRIYVLDHQAKEVRVFGPQGEFVRTIGRSGSGPGEFRNPFGLAIGPDDDLWVFDPGNGRYTVFDSAGHVTDTYRRPLGFFAVPWLGGLSADGRLFDVGGAGEQEATPILVRVDTSGVAADTTWLPRYERSMILLRRQGIPVMGISDPFSPSLIWRFDPRGYVWYAQTETYEITQADLSGDTVRLIRLAVDAVPVTAAEADSALEAIDASMEQAGGGAAPDRAPIVPDTKPFITNFVVDDQGYLWAVPQTTRESAPSVDIFDPVGRYMGRLGLDVALPASPIPVFRDGSLYIVTQNSLGVQQVVRYDITRS